MQTKLLMSAAALSLLFSSPVALAADSTDDMSDTSTDMMEMNTDTETTTDTDTDSEPFMTMSERNTATTYEDGSPRVLINKEAAEQYLMRYFLQVGAEDMNVDDADGIFDISAYMSHPCFDIVGWYELKTCEQNFGVYANLRETLVSGLLGEMLHRHNMGLMSGTDLTITSDDGFDALAPGAFGGASGEELVNDMQDNMVAPSAGEDQDADEIFNDNMQERSRRVWELCGERFSDAQSACYQNNIRLVKDMSIPFNDISDNIR